MWCRVPSLFSTACANHRSCERHSYLVPSVRSDHFRLRTDPGAAPAQLVDTSPRQSTVWFKGVRIPLVFLSRECAAGVGLLLPVFATFPEGFFPVVKWLEPRPSPRHPTPVPLLLAVLAGWISHRAKATCANIARIEGWIM